jgi:hypothetical protein
MIKTYKLVSLPVVLHGCETWSLIFREEHILRMFENRVRRRMFGPQTDEVMGGWRQLHNWEFHTFYFSPNITMIKSQRMRCVGHVACMGIIRSVYTFRLASMKGRNYHLQEQGVDERIILKWILEKWNLRMLTGLTWIRIGTGARLL